MLTVQKISPPNRGDIVGVIAPASAPANATDVDRGIKYLSARGFTVERYRPTFAPNGYLAGTDVERAGELNHFLARPEVTMVFCARGGYGCLRILKMIDYEAARANPTVVVGYSDITAVQLALLKHSACPSISGPMVAVEMSEMPEIDDPTAKCFWNLVSADTKTSRGALVSPSGSELIPVVTGSATGRLVGGNLSVLAKLVGTPYLPDLSGAILFIEDVGEPPYRIDGLLGQLENAGILGGIAGLAIGAFTGTDRADGKPTLSIDDVIARYTSALNIPVATNLAYGHFPVKNAIPMGVQAQLEVEPSIARLTLLESLVDTDNAIQRTLS